MEKRANRSMDCVVSPSTTRVRKKTFHCNQQVFNCRWTCSVRGVSYKQGLTRQADRLSTAMNPLTNIRSRQRQRENEVINGIPDSASYHTEYRNSAYIYAGQLSFNLTEGDLLAIFSEYGEVVDVNLVRDKKTGKSRGFAFLAYEDQRSTDLAVDNLNGYSIDGRVIGVDHVKDYKRLKENPDFEDPANQQPNNNQARR